jgi:2-C-methyl-D-erythritol 4-phosphate cytidylyltransferase
VADYLCLMKKTAIIVAGGIGSRLNAETPKQFIPIGGIPMLAYSIKAFHQYDPEMEIIVVLPEGFADQWRQLSHAINLNIPIKIVHGGSERFHSVQNALHAINHKEGLVAIHDAARPFVTQLLIDSTFNHAERSGSAIPAIPVKDSLRIKVLNEWTAADRTKFHAVQTPQVFDLARLKAAYLQEYMPEFTDDATVYEKAGNRVNLIEGEENNIKITTARDLEFAEFISSKW